MIDRNDAVRYYRISMSGFLLGLIITLCLENNMDTVNIAGNDIILAFVVTIGIGTAILVCSIIRRIFYINV